MLDHVDHLACLECGEHFRPSRRASCPHCASGGRLRYAYRTDDLAPFDRGLWARREPWLWRFRELLPFEDDFDPPPLQVGMTPLYGSPRLARACGVRGLFIKDESRQPSGRVRDRAAALLVAGAQGGGKPLVAGPLAGSVAPFAAAAELPLLALVRGTPGPELAAYGARPLALDSHLDPTEALVRLQALGYPLADQPHPLAFEGLKTLGLEIGDQLAERLPEWVVVDGTEPGLVDAVTEGLAQCAALELFRRPPRILTVGGAGGEVQVDLPEGEALGRFAALARSALGLPIDEAGARGLAGLAAAVRRELVPAEALALVVVEGAPRLPEPPSWSPPEVVRDWSALGPAAEAAARPDSGRRHG